jgi:hypothetical protein
MGMRSKSNMIVRAIDGINMQLWSLSGDPPGGPGLDGSQNLFSRWLRLQRIGCKGELRWQ